MKIRLLALLLLALPTLTSAREGGETQNGGGAAEQNFGYALAILKPLYEMCLSEGNCVRSDSQAVILNGILNHLDEELRADTILRFESGATDPERFFLDGQVRIAVTGLTVGSPIYVNRDLIYRRDGASVTPYAVSEAVGVLTHELGHHQGITDHDTLDVLAGNVRAFFESSQDHLRLDTFTDFFDEAHVVLNVFHTRDDAAPYAHRSHFWLSVDSRVFDLNAEIQKKLRCPEPGMRLAGFRFSHMGWGDASVVSNGRLTIPLDARVWIECAGSAAGAPSYESKQYIATIRFPFRVNGRRLDYVENSLELSLEL
jgi:hypothetical protein